MDSYLLQSVFYYVCSCPNWAKLATSSVLRTSAHDEHIVVRLYGFRNCLPKTKCQKLRTHMSLKNLINTPPCNFAYKSRPITIQIQEYLKDIGVLLYLSAMSAIHEIIILVQNVHMYSLQSVSQCVWVEWRTNSYVKDIFAIIAKLMTQKILNKNAFQSNANHLLTDSMGYIKLEGM